MKKTASVLFIAFFSIFVLYFSVNANPGVMNFLENGKKIHHTEKDGKRVNQCAYCHSDTGIKQLQGSKQGFMKGQANYGKLATMKKCSGSGCHVK